ncbi:MAG: hypothetical protein WC967_15585 [Balneolaceae bacterium]
MIIWSETRIPPINLYVMAALTPDFEAKIEKSTRKTTNRVDFSALYRKRMTG